MEDDEVQLQAFAEAEGETVPEERDLRLASSIMSRADGVSRTPSGMGLPELIRASTSRAVRMCGMSGGWVNR